MSSIAKAYLASVLSLGAGVLLFAALHWNSANLARFFVYLLLGLLASTWKVKLPGFTGTISGNFLFILIGISAFHFSETIFLAAASALVQSFWGTKKKPMPAQVAFNAAVLSASAAAAWAVASALAEYAHANSLAILLVAAACTYFVADTCLVSGVIALVERKPFMAVWRACNGWSFPYYVLGAGLAALITVSSRSAGWTFSLLIAPAMYLIYAYYHFYVESATQERLRIQVNDQEHEMVVSTH